MEEKVLEHYIHITNHVRETLRHIQSDLDVKLKFHVRWGLEKLRYTADHAFVRGWEVSKIKLLHVATALV